MDEWTIITVALKCLPAALMALVLLALLVDEYLRLMELAGLARARTRARREQTTERRTGKRDEPD